MYKFRLFPVLLILRLKLENYKKRNIVLMLSSTKSTHQKAQDPLHTIHQRFFRKAKSYKKYQISTIHKPTNTIENFLVHPKDQTADQDKYGVIYQLNCQQCDHFYIRQSGRK